MIRQTTELINLSIIIIIIIIINFTGSSVKEVEVFHKVVVRHDTQTTPLPDPPPDPHPV